MKTYIIYYYDDPEFPHMTCLEFSVYVPLDSYFYSVFKYDVRNTFRIDSGTDLVIFTNKCEKKKK